MSQLTCAGCGSVYPMTGVQALDTFTCSVCHRVIVVPIAGPSAARAAHATARARPDDLPPPIPAPPPVPAPRRVPAPKPVPAPPPRPAPTVRERDGEPRRMKPIAGLGVAVTAAFVVQVLSEFVEVYQRWLAILFVGELRPGVAPDMDRAAEIDAATRHAVIANLVVTLVLAILFCSWFHRAHSNLRLAKLPKIEYGSGWTIGGFFVPILNLVRPAQLMTETWAGTSYLAGTSRAASWKRSPSNPLVGWWWGLFLASSIAGNVAVRLALRGDGGPGGVTAEAWVSIGSSVLSVAAAVAAISLVRRISDLQEHARRR
jgi:hypothetical protein